MIKIVKAITSMERMTRVLTKFLEECDGDTLCAIFDYTFGTQSRDDPSSENVIIEPGREDEYCGILEEEFKGDIRYHIDL